MKTEGNQGKPRKSLVFLRFSLTLDPPSFTDGLDGRDGNGVSEVVTNPQNSRQIQGLHEYTGKFLQIIAFL